MSDTPLTDRAIEKSVEEGVYVDARLAMLCRDLERRLPDTPKWIPVGERLPAEDQQVLIYSPSAVDRMHVVLRRTIDSQGRSPARDECFAWWSPCPITHWMPLPEAPK